MLKLENISKSYKIWKTDSVQILKNINLEIGENEFIAIIGPSWSWKSTLMNIIWLLDREFEWDAILNWVNIKKQKDSKLAELRWKSIWFVFQNYSLIPRISALDQILIPLDYAKVPRNEWVQRAKTYLDKVGLLDKIKSKPNEMSWGQNQRVSIARALASHPSIILADEPTWALDSKTWAEILDLFEKIHSEWKTVIIITHDSWVAARAKRIIEIKDWEIVGDRRRE